MNKLKNLVQKYMDGNLSPHMDTINNRLKEIYGYETYVQSQYEDSILSRRDESRKDYYPYIPLHPMRFLNVLKSLRLLFGHRESFIDVGCGIGEKVLLAHHTEMFDKCYGIEYSSYTHDIAKSKIEPIIGSNTIIYGDAFAHDFSTYDTIYMYCPIQNPDTMLRLLEYIYKTMREDAIIIFFNGSVPCVANRCQERCIQYLYSDGAYILYKKPLPFFPKHMEET